MELLNQYQEAMRKLLGEEYNDYIDSFTQRRVYGLRLNALKASDCKEHILKELFGEGEAKPVPWAPYGYYYPEQLRLSRHPYYYAGLYYLQEPSAMAPAAFLPVKPNDRVLDLCAAPGGKSTQLAARLNGEGFLLSNDYSHSRALALLKNMELAGVTNAFISAETPEKLSSVYPEYFDSILVDAPCSGEGMFRRDPDMVKSWTEKGPAYYAPLQKRILKEAVKMLRPGGYLLYSTCTFSTEEDEECIAWLLMRYDSLSLASLDVPPGFEQGRCGLERCVRLFPHKIKGEGHFMALLHKAGNADGLESQTKREDAEPSCSGEAELPAAVREFLELTDTDWNRCRFMFRDGRLYALPKESPLRQGIRYLRTGWFLGELAGRPGGRQRFEPGQALAMGLKGGEFKNTVNLSAKDPRTVKYLKGETLDVSGAEIRGESGWCLVLCDGFPLGFAKRDGSRLKNKYCPGWRWQG